MAKGKQVNMAEGSGLVGSLAEVCKFRKKGCFRDCLASCRIQGASGGEMWLIAHSIGLQEVQLGYSPVTGIEPRGGCEGSKNSAKELSHLGFFHESKF